MSEIDFSEISRDDIINAFAEYDRLEKENKINTKRKEKDYLLFWNSKEYPHKYIIGIAYGLKYNQEALENTLYGSTGNHKKSARWCIEKNGFILYADTKYKQYLQKKYDNQTTINTYHSDLKKAIKIFQNIERLKEKNLNEIFEIMQNRDITFEEYDKAQKELGFDDKQLYSTLKTKSKEYLNALLENNDENHADTITEEQENLFYQFAQKHNLLNREPHMSKGRIYYQIYPKNSPKKEGTGGCHYEFGFDKNDKTLKLFLHVEPNVQNQKKLKNILEWKSAIIADVTDLDDSEIESIFDDTVRKYEDKINNFYGENTMNQTQPLNQILYGPPGTGKTYHTINKALQIILEKQPNDEIKQLLSQDTHSSEDRKKLQDKFEEYKKTGQIEFVTFHQSYGYEEFVEGIKAKTTDSGIEYKIESGIFKKLSKKATTNFEQTQENIVAKKDFDVIFKERVLDKVFEDVRLEIKMKKSSFFIKEIDETHIYFDKSGGDSQHVLLLKNLRAMYETGENKLIMGGLSQYYNPLLEYLLKDSEIKEEEKEPLKNYILIIDEINRGNISKIFGELITLIEKSKRIGKDEALHVRLPYSNEPFGVPSNLYIIGTMNTADRSIALMDTALRRRFDFEEMMPRPDLLKKEDGTDLEVGGINIKSLLRTINKRIEYLYDRDHTIGHAYFMSLKDKSGDEAKKELDNIFKNKIIPLLQEYFYDDWEKIQMVLGDHPSQKATDENKFVKNIEQTEISLFGFDHEEIENEQVTYVLNTKFTTNAYSKIKLFEKEK